MTANSRRLQQLLLPAAMGAFAAIVAGMIYASVRSDSVVSDAVPVADVAVVEPPAPMPVVAPEPTPPPSPAPTPTYIEFPRPVPIVAPPPPAQPPVRVAPVARQASPDDRRLVSPSAPVQAPAPPEPAPGPSRRDQALAERYAGGLAAMKARSYREAVTVFEELERDAAGYRDVATQVASARGFIREAETALSAAAAAEKGNDLPVAFEQYQRAQQIDPGVSGASLALERVRARMKQAGGDAELRGRLFEANQRFETAITAYEEALRILPPDDPLRQRVQTALAELQKSR